MKYTYARTLFARLRDKAQHIWLPSFVSVWVFWHWVTCQCWTLTIDGHTFFHCVFNRMLSIRLCFKVILSFRFFISCIVVPLEPFLLLLLEWMCGSHGAAVLSCCFPTVELHMNNAEAPALLLIAIQSKDVWNNRGTRGKRCSICNGPLCEDTGFRCTKKSQMATDRCSSDRDVNSQWSHQLVNEGSRLLRGVVGHVSGCTSVCV